MLFLKLQIMPYRYFIHLSYDGTAFHGWQIQPNGTTVQELLEQALAMAGRLKVRTTGCGRTDTGVHARNFYAHFDVEEPILDPAALAYRLDRFLPPSVAIHNVLPVAAEGHARFSAEWRTYHYTILRKKDPFREAFAYLYTGPLDIELMNTGAGRLLLHRDFECFSKVKTEVNNFHCHIFEALWIEKPGELVFRIRADRFLRNMVRAIVGTLIELGKHKIDLEDLEAILNSRNRSMAGMSVPAQGLILEEIKYPDSIFNNQPGSFKE